MDIVLKYLNDKLDSEFIEFRAHNDYIELGRNNDVDGTSRQLYSYNDISNCQCWEDVSIYDVEKFMDERAIDISELF